MSEPRYLSDWPHQLEKLDAFPAKMEVKIKSYKALGLGVHFYVDLVTDHDHDPYIEISLYRPTLLIEREQRPDLKNRERTSDFATKDAAIARAIEFGQEHGIHIWKKAWFVAGRDARGEWEDYTEETLYKPEVPDEVA